MFGPKFAFFCAACLLRFDPVFCPKQAQRKAKPGEDVPLQCQGPRGASITLIKWNRPDLKSDQYVFLFRDGHLNGESQLPSFRGRVELRDPEMKDGNASVVLKNVTTNDSGTYECRVSSDSNRRSKRAIDPISIITLTVTDPDPDPGLTAAQKEEGNKEGGNKEGGNKDGGNKDGGNKEGGNKDGGNKEEGNKDSVGVRAGVPVAVLLLVIGVVVGLVIFRRRRGRTEKNSHQPAETESLRQQV